MEVRRSTVGVYEDSLACQLLGQTYYVHPDKTIKITVDLVVTSEVIGAVRARDAVVPRARSFSLAGTAPGRAEVQIKELGFHFVDPLAPIAEKEIVPRVRVGRRPPHRRAKYLQAMHVKNRMLKKCCYTLYLLELADRLRGEASRETLKTARKNVVEAEGEYQLALSNYRQMELWCFFKFANAIARKAAEARGETFVPTPYDETAVDAVVVTAVPPVAPVVSAPAGPPLKALEAMGKKELSAELDKAGVPSKGRSVVHTAIEVLRDLVRRLRAGEPAASLKATLVADGAKKVKFDYCKKGNANGTDYLIERFRGLAETDPLRLEFDELARRDVAAAAADELPVDRLQRVPDPGLVNLPTIWPRMRFPVRVATLGLERPRLFPASRYAQPECGVRYPYGSKLGLFKGRVGGGARCMCYRVIRDAKRRIANHLPRAEDDQCPAYYGVDYRESRGARTCQFTVHEGTKTLAQKSAPADPRFEAFGSGGGGNTRGNVLSHPTAVAVYRRDLGVHAPPRALTAPRSERLERKNRIAGGAAAASGPVVDEALRSLENAFSEFMPERFYGIRGHETAYSCPEGKFQALASIPGARGGGNRDDAITFGLYDSKVEVSIQEKHRISEVVVARIEEVNVARAGAEKPLPPLHTAASTAAVANFYRDPCGLLAARAPPASRRVAKLYVVPNCEVVSPPPPPIYHVTENGERLLVLYATLVQRPLIPAIQQVHKQRSEFLSLFDESEVEMAAAMFDSRPIEIARPLLFESEEDAERRAEPAAPKRKRKSRKKKRKPAAPEAPAEAPAASPPTAPPAEAPAEAPPPAAAPAKKKKKKRSRRRGPAPPAEISEYERTRMRNIAAGNKKLYSLGLIHPPPEVVADPEHRGGPSARTRFVSRFDAALPQAQS
ncbi:hypothetical protein JL721_418 [Aureococcus anophagefferens]|nr:hypothetical protein JL721_418 [Aureococcus anophagefferens]